MSLYMDRLLYHCPVWSSPFRRILFLQSDNSTNPLYKKTSCTIIVQRIRARKLAYTSRACDSKASPPRSVDLCFYDTIVRSISNINIIGRGIVIYSTWVVKLSYAAAYTSECLPPSTIDLCFDDTMICVV